MKTFQEWLNESISDSKQNQKMYKDTASALQKTSEFKALQAKLFEMVDVIVKASENKIDKDMAITMVWSALKPH